jgi:diguanylate cyclase (GGDEF)-like protein
MSLIKQLWLGIIMILLLALGGSFAISILSAKSYLQEQLQLKNIDNANSLALSLSQMEKDPVTLELLLSAQFDTGHYQQIVLTDPTNNILLERVSSAGTDNSVPFWFARLADLQVSPGVALVQDGWQQYATLTLESHTRFAHLTLWNSTLHLLQWFLVAALISGLMGTWILKYISRPLDVVVQQAEAISEKRFITSQEPRTTEFQRLVRAMNALSESVKSMLDKETRQLEILRRESQHDDLTGLFNRAHFLNLLDAQLTREDSENSGTLMITRVLNLADINHQLGRAEVDQALSRIAMTLQEFVAQYPGSYAARLNGSDFALVIADCTTTEDLSDAVSKALRQALAQQLPMIALPLAACRYHAGEKRNEIMHKLDGALAQAEFNGDHAVITLAPDNLAVVHRNINEWRDAITTALNEHKLELASFPVKTTTNDILHFEAPVRLQLDDHLQPAGYFVPWASRLGMMPTIDIEVVKTALHQLSFLQTPLAINVSADALCDARFREQVITLLTGEKDKARDLWLEFSESCALRHPAEFRSFSHILRELGCRVGLEHVGPEFTHISELQDIGLSYLKIDSSVIRDIDTNIGNQGFVQGLSKIGHSLGMIMIAEGVKTAGESETLFKLGLDAVTGPGV